MIIISTTFSILNLIWSESESHNTTEDYLVSNTIREIVSSYTNHYSAECLHKPKDQRFFLEIILNDFVSSFRFIWISMLWVYGHYNMFLFQCGDRLWTSESDVYSGSPRWKG